MIKKTLLLTTILLTSLAAYTNFSPYETKVESVNGKYIQINDSTNFKIGSSGILIHNFDDEHSTITANVEVVDKKDGKAILSFKKFDTLEQNALPSYNIPPSIGDKVILNYLYTKSMAIVPDKETLKSVTNKFSQLDWIHPDIFASKLAIDYTPKPSKKDFQEECKANSFSLLFFAIDNSGYFVDCNSFKVLYKVDISNQATQKPQTPFYNRIGDIKGRMFGLMGGNSITNYDDYYKKLLNVR